MAGSSGVARARLLGDQVARPVIEQRVRLAVLSRRLDQAGRGALMRAVAGRVREDRRFGAVFGQLVELSIGS